MVKFNSSILLKRDDLNKEVCGDKTQEPIDQQVFIESVCIYKSEQSAV